MAQEVSQGMDHLLINYDNNMEYEIIQMGWLSPSYTEAKRAFHVSKVVQH